MSEATQQRLLELNRNFYAQVAADFDQTRGSLAAGWQKLAAFLPRSAPTAPRSVLDVGCGNGRFARALADWGAFRYVGIDADRTLLQAAIRHTADLSPIEAQFQPVDLTTPGWSAPLRSTNPGFDVVVCFAVLHHLPGYELRRQVLCEIASCLADQGVLMLSNWQFLTTARFAEKRIPWPQIGLTEADVEPGDALLPWQQGRYALRYVHQIDEAETAQLALAAGLTVIDHFYADGKEENLNLYTILR